MTPTLFAELSEPPVKEEPNKITGPVPVAVLIHREPGEGFHVMLSSPFGMFRATLLTCDIEDLEKAIEFEAERYLPYGYSGMEMSAVKEWQTLKERKQG